MPFKVLGESPSLYVPKLYIVRRVAYWKPGPVWRFKGRTNVLSVANRERSAVRRQLDTQHFAVSGDMSLDLTACRINEKHAAFVKIGGTNSDYISGPVLFQNSA